MPVEIMVGHKIRVFAGTVGAIKPGSAKFTTADPLVAVVTPDPDNETEAEIVGVKEGVTEMTLEAHRDGTGAVVRDTDTVTVVAAKGFTFEYGSPVALEPHEMPVVYPKTEPVVESGPLWPSKPMTFDEQNAAAVRTENAREGLGTPMLTAEQRAIQSDELKR